MVSKEEFNKVWKDTSREGILNQFYYEHIELRKMIDNFNELEKWLEDYIKLFDKPDMLEEQTLEDLKEVLNKLQELKGSDKDA